jgi:hypothetical protein
MQARRLHRLLQCSHKPHSTPYSGQACRSAPVTQSWSAPSSFNATPHSSLMMPCLSLVADAQRLACRDSGQSLLGLLCRHPPCARQSRGSAETAAAVCAALEMPRAPAVAVAASQTGLSVTVCYRCLKPAAREASAAPQTPPLSEAAPRLCAEQRPRARPSSPHPPTRPGAPRRET